jgi:hypothetical protein
LPVPPVDPLLPVLCVLPPPVPVPGLGVAAGRAVAVGIAVVVAVAVGIDTGFGAVVGLVILPAEKEISRSSPASFSVTAAATACSAGTAPISTADSRPALSCEQPPKANTAISPHVRIIFAAFISLYLRSVFQLHCMGKY